jgi:lipopolysaccharide transport protein LptA
VRALLLAGLVLCLVVAGGVGQAAPAPQPSPTSATGVDGLGRLRADRIRYDARARLIVATGNVSLALGDLQIRADTLRLEQDAQVATAEGRVTVRQRESRLAAPVLRYELRTEMAEASGGVVLVQRDATIKAPRITFDLHNDVTAATGGVEVVQGDTTVTAGSLRHNARTGDVVADGGVTLTQPGSKVTGRRLQANLRTRRADVRGDVTLVRAPGPPPPGRPDQVATAVAKEETTITAARIVFGWDANEGEAEDHVVIRQKDRTAWADRLTYSEPSNRVVLTGHVVLEQQSADGLVHDGVTTPPPDPNERAALASITRMTCTRLTMAIRERDIVADGLVTVTQKDRSASGDQGTYTEATRLLVLSGNVRMQEADGRRLRADRVVISLVEETFEAEGNVQTEFVIHASPTRRP